MAALVCGVPVLAGALLLVRRPTGPRELIIIRLADIFPDPGAARHVGRLVLDSLPSTETDDLLLELFSDDTWNSPGEATATLLQKRVQLDFENNHTITASFWTLSRTEALFYALVSRLTGGLGGFM